MGNVRGNVAGNARFSDDFKHDAVHQIVERGYAVADVSKRLGVSTHSLYAWMKHQSAEIRRLLQPTET